MLPGEHILYLILPAAKVKTGDGLKDGWMDGELITRHICPPDRHFPALS